jgi:hypothetical protein
MKVAELKKYLDERFIKYPKGAKKAYLQKLFDSLKTVADLNPERKVRIVNKHVYVSPQKAVDLDEEPVYLESYTDRKGVTRIGNPAIPPTFGKPRLETQEEIDAIPAFLAKSKREYLAEKEQEQIERVAKKSGITEQEAKRRLESLAVALTHHPVEAPLSGVKGPMTPSNEFKQEDELEDRVNLEGEKALANVLTKNETVNKAQALQNWKEFTVAKRNLIKPSQRFKLAPLTFVPPEPYVPQPTPKPEEPDDSPIRPVKKAPKTIKTDRARSPLVTFEPPVKTEKPSPRNAYPSPYTFSMRPMGTPKSQSPVPETPKLTLYSKTPPTTPKSKPSPRPLGTPRKPVVAPDKKEALVFQDDVTAELKRKQEQKQIEKERKRVDESGEYTEQEKIDRRKEFDRQERALRASQAKAEEEAKKKAEKKAEEAKREKMKQKTEQKESKKEQETFELQRADERAESKKLSAVIDKDKVALDARLDALFNPDEDKLEDTLRQKDEQLEKIRKSILLREVAVKALIKSNKEVFSKAFEALKRKKEEAKNPKAVEKQITNLVEEQKQKVEDTQEALDLLKQERERVKQELSAQKKAKAEEAKKEKEARKKAVATLKSEEAKKVLPDLERLEREEHDRIVAEVLQYQAQLLAEEKMEQRLKEELKKRGIVEPEPEPPKPPKKKKSQMTDDELRNQGGLEHAKFILKQIDKVTKENKKFSDLVDESEMKEFIKEKLKENEGRLSVSLVDEIFEKAQRRGDATQLKKALQKPSIKRGFAKLKTNVKEKAIEIADAEAKRLKAEADQLDIDAQKAELQRSLRQLPETSRPLSRPKIRPPNLDEEAKRLKQEADLLELEAHKAGLQRSLKELSPDTERALSRPKKRPNEARQKRMLEALKSSLEKGSKVPLKKGFETLKENVKQKKLKELEGEADSLMVAIRKSQDRLDALKTKSKDNVRKSQEAVARKREESKNVLSSISELTKEAESLVKKVETKKEQEAKLRKLLPIKEGEDERQLSNLKEGFKRLKDSTEKSKKEEAKLRSLLPIKEGEEERGLSNLKEGFKRLKDSTEKSKKEEAKLKSLLPIKEGEDKRRLSNLKEGLKRLKDNAESSKKEEAKLKGLIPIKEGENKRRLSNLKEGLKRLKDNAEKSKKEEAKLRSLLPIKEGEEERSLSNLKEGFKRLKDNSEKSKKEEAKLRSLLPIKRGEEERGLSNLKEGFKRLKDNVEKSKEEDAKLRENITQAEIAKELEREAKEQERNLKLEDVIANAKEKGIKGFKKEAFEKIKAQAEETKDLNKKGLQEAKLAIRSIQKLAKDDERFADILKMVDYRKRFNELMSERKNRLTPDYVKKVFDTLLDETVKVGNKYVKLNVVDSRAEKRLLKQGFEKIKAQAEERKAESQAQAKELEKKLKEQADAKAKRDADKEAEQENIKKRVKEVREARAKADEKKKSVLTKGVERTAKKGKEKVAEAFEKLKKNAQEKAEIDVLKLLDDLMSQQKKKKVVLIKGVERTAKKGKEKVAKAFETLKENARTKKALADAEAVADAEADAQAEAQKLEDVLSGKRPKTPSPRVRKALPSPRVRKPEPEPVPKVKKRAIYELTDKEVNDELKQLRQDLSAGREVDARRIEALMRREKILESNPKTKPDPEFGRKLQEQEEKRKVKLEEIEQLAKSLQEEKERKEKIDKAVAKAKEKQKQKREAERERIRLERESNKKEIDEMVKARQRQLSEEKEKIEQAREVARKKQKERRKEAKQEKERIERETAERISIELEKEKALNTLDKLAEKAEDISKGEKKILKQAIKQEEEITEAQKRARIKAYKDKVAKAKEERASQKAFKAEKISEERAKKALEKKERNKMLKAERDYIKNLTKPISQEELETKSEKWLLAKQKELQEALEKDAELERKGLKKMEIKDNIELMRQQRAIEGIFVEKLKAKKLKESFKKYGKEQAKKASLAKLDELAMRQKENAEKERLKQQEKLSRKASADVVTKPPSPVKRKTSMDVVAPKPVPVDTKDALLEYMNQVPRNIRAMSITSDNAPVYYLFVQAMKAKKYDLAEAIADKAHELWRKTSK